MGRESLQILNVEMELLVTMSNTDSSARSPNSRVMLNLQPQEVRQPARSAQQPTAETDASRQTFRRGLGTGYPPAPSPGLGEASYGFTTTKSSLLFLDQHSSFCSMQMGFSSPKLTT